MKFTPNMSQSGTPEIPAQEGTPSSISTTAYQLAMQQAVTTPTSIASPAAQALPAEMPSKDVVMSDHTPDRAASPAILPPRTGTPSRHLNGNGNDSSRAASLHPEPSTIPKEAPPHGAPVRQYINGKVTGPLMDGMKILAKEQPKDPLRVLGEYLLQRSRELEGT